MTAVGIGRRFRGVARADIALAIVAMAYIALTLVATRVHGVARANIAMTTVATCVQGVAMAGINIQCRSVTVAQRRGNRYGGAGVGG